MKKSRMLAYNIKAAKRYKRARHGNGAVLVLVIFQNGNKRARNCHSGAVEHVDEFIFAVIVLVAHIEPPRQISREV
jgi:hypothetical protein